MRSWYVANSCISMDELKPLSLILIGSIIQICMTCFIFIGNAERLETAERVMFYQTFRYVEDHSDDVKAVTDQNIQEKSNIESASINLNATVVDHKCNCCRSVCKCIKYVAKSKFLKWMKIGYMVWQILSIITIFVMDILRFSNLYSKFNSNWERYQCFATIFLISSNAKTLLSYWISFHFLLQDIRILEIYAPPQYKLKFLYRLGIAGWFYMLLLFLYGFVGIWMYCWIGFGVLLCYQFIVECVVFKWLKTKLESFCKLCQYVVTVGELYSMLAIFIVPVIVSMLFIICGLSAVNVYSGISYWNSLKFVIIERHWEAYVNYMWSSLEGKFRFITIIF
eukprot:451292_1